MGWEGGVEDEERGGGLEEFGGKEWMWSKYTVDMYKILKENIKSIVLKIYFRKDASWTVPGSFKTKDQP